MYNIDYLTQIEAHRRDLFGNCAIGHDDCLRMSDEASRRYVPPTGVRIVKCHEDTNGEWVPIPSK